jgi:hypothetical protein
VKKAKFGFFYDLNTYSIKELVVNYFVMFGWILAIIIEIINCCVCKDYIDAIIAGKIAIKPWIFDKLTRFAFVFLALTIFGGILKIIWSRKRKQGKILSYYDTVALQQTTLTNGKPKMSWIIKGTFIGVAVVFVVLVMLAVWLF